MTSSQLATRNGTSDISWTDEQKRLIQSTIAPGCSADELRLFAYHCQRTGLDPFSRQIYAIKRGGKMTVQAGIDGLRAIAERTGQLDGCQRFWCGEDGEWKDVWLAPKPPAAAKCIIHRKNCSHPFVGVALFRDYNAGQGLWTKMPSVMLGKVAEAQALRSGFPADLSGLYSSEEMEQADVKTINVTPAAPAPAPAPVAAAAAAPTTPAFAVVVVEESAPEPTPTPEPATPEPQAPAAAVDQSPTDGDKLRALVTLRLTATGRKALLKAYEPVQSGLKDIDEWLVTFIPQAKAHLAGLTEETIAALNDGKHPKSGEVLINKPGRRPAAAPSPTDGPIGDDPEQPFATA